MATSTAPAPAPAPRTRRKGPAWGNLPGHVLIIGLCILTLFPIYWMFATSLRPSNAIFDLELIPSVITFDNYLYVFRTIPIVNMMFNTFANSLLQTVFQVVTAILAAYAFARWEFPGSRIFFLLFVATWLVPLQVTMIPNYVLLARLGWLNSLAALVIPQLAAAFAVILLRQYMKSFPRELIDAAWIDGAGNWRILWGIIVPNLRAPLAALGILMFISTWNEYFWPLLVTNRPESTVIQVGLQMFLSGESESWGPLMAAASLASIPIFVLYLLLQRQVVDAFVRSGLK